MCNWKFAAVVTAGMFGVATPALAGVAGVMNVTVTPLQINTTYSVIGPPPLNSVVGYQVNINNGGKNTSNKVSFRAELEITDAAELATFDFDSAEGRFCAKTTTAPPARLQIECPIGDLKSGQVVPTFYIFFKTPRKILNGIADSQVPIFTDFVNLYHQVLYAEGKNGPKSKPANGFTPLTAAPQVALGTANPELVRSVVLASGGTFFTGNGGVAAVGDPHATKSVVPTLAAHTTVEIAESGVACSGNVFTCYTSQITVPGTFAASPYLTIGLSQRIENIRFLPCAGSHYAYRSYSTYTTTPSTCTSTTRIPIEQIEVFYEPDAPAPQTPLLVPLCSLPSPFVPPTDRPCIAARTVVKDYPGGPKVRYEWTLISFKNGRYAIK